MSKSVRTRLSCVGPAGRPRHLAEAPQHVVVIVVVVTLATLAVLGLPVGDVLTAIGSIPVITALVSPPTKHRPGRCPRTPRTV